MKRGEPLKRRIPLKRTEMKGRKIPLRSTKALPRTAMPPRTTGIRSRSEHRDEVEAAWRRDRDAHLAAHPRCEIGPRLAQARIPQYRRCGGHATEVHHAKARGMGGSRDNSELVSACRDCHVWTEAHPRQAEQIGVKIRHST